MANPFSILDLSDDESPAAASGSKKSSTAAATTTTRVANNNSAAAKKDHSTLKKEEEELQQKKKGQAGSRGGQHGGPQNVVHPGERSKVGIRKEEHVNTHKKPSDSEPKERGGRQFDRHSGTGRGREIKKGGAGGHNWGKPGDENAPLPSTTPEPAAAAADGGEAAAPAEPIPEEPATLTLEEYQKLQAAKREGIAFQEKKQVRKVEAPKDAAAYKKDEEEGEGDYIKLKQDEKKEKEQQPKKQNEKQVLVLDFKIKSTEEAAPRREDRGDRSRGGDRRSPRADGDRPSRGDRPSSSRGGKGSYPRAAAPTGGRLDTADTSAFPKLGAS